jgi:hypothetical protein
MEPVSAGQLGPLRILRACAVIDDGRAGRRAGRLGPIGCVGRHALRAIGRLAAAADRPHSAVSVQQLGHDAAADRARRAEDHVQGTARLGHRDAPFPAFHIARGPGIRELFR